MYIGIYVKYRLFLSGLNETWIFSTDFRKKYNQIPNFMEIVIVGAELFHADGRTERYGKSNSPFFLQFPENV